MPVEIMVTGAPGHMGATRDREFRCAIRQCQRQQQCLQYQPRRSGGTDIEAIDTGCCYTGREAQALRAKPIALNLCRADRRCGSYCREVLVPQPGVGARGTDIGQCERPGGQDRQRQSAAQNLTTALTHCSVELKHHPPTRPFGPVWRRHAGRILPDARRTRPCNTRPTRHTDQSNATLTLVTELVADQGHQVVELLRQ